MIVDDLVDTGVTAQIIRDMLPKRSIPVLTHCPVGHGNEMWTLPLGIEATLDTQTRSLRLKSKGVT